MILESHAILSAAVRLLQACGSGLLITHLPGEEARLWIGTPVHTVNGHLLFSRIDPDSDLVVLAAGNPRATWRFHEPDGQLIVFWEGTLSVLPASVVRHGTSAANGNRIEHAAVSLVTNVLSVIQVVPSTKQVSRVVLPAVRSGPCSSRPALAF